MTIDVLPWTSRAPIAWTGLVRAGVREVLSVVALIVLGIVGVTLAP